MSFYTEVLMKDPRFHSTDRCDDMSLLEPNFRAKIVHFIELAKSIGHDVRTLETYRSPARQEQLFKQGATQLRKVGVHGYGLAWDGQLLVNGVYDPDGQDYMFFMTVAKQDDVLSGINWGEPRQPHSFKDYDHLQGIPIFRQPALFSGTWYPPPDYDPWKDEQEHGVQI